MTRVVKPFQQLGYLIATGVMAAIAALWTAAFAMVFLLFVFVIALSVYPFMLLAIPGIVLWPLLMIPSLIVRGDFRWPCTALRFCARPALAYVDKLGNADDDWLLVEHWPISAAESLWSCVTKLAQHIEGCQ